jgi:hypothetical protein
MEFKKGVKFKYLGSYFISEYGRTQQVLNIVTVNGLQSVRSVFLDNEYVHIFEIWYKDSYSKHCYPVDILLDNGIPLFWEEHEEF